jgi:hypothetical protein
MLYPLFTFSHISNLSTQLQNIAPKAWISQRDVGESSKGYWSIIQMVKNQQPMREGVDALL